MPTPMRRTVPRKTLSKRRVVNVQTLQMMLRSGVVRRADSLPPLPFRQARMKPSDEQQRAGGKDVVQAQGWLSRVIFGPRPQPIPTKRSLFDGGQ